MILPDPIGPPHHAHSCRQHFLPFSFALLLLLLVPLPWHCCLPRHLRRQCFLCRRRVVACVSIDNKTQAKLKDEEEDVLLPLASICPRLSPLGLHREEPSHGDDTVCTKTVVGMVLLGSVYAPLRSRFSSIRTPPVLLLLVRPRLFPMGNDPFL